MRFPTVLVCIVAAGCGGGATSASESTPLTDPARHVAAMEREVLARLAPFESPNWGAYVEVDCFEIQGDEPHVPASLERSLDATLFECFGFYANGRGDGGGTFVTVFDDGTWVLHG